MLVILLAVKIPANNVSLINILKDKNNIMYYLTGRFWVKVRRYDYICPCIRIWPLVHTLRSWTEMIMRDCILLACVCVPDFTSDLCIYFCMCLWCTSDSTLCIPSCVCSQMRVWPHHSVRLGIRKCLSPGPDTLIRQPVCSSEIKNRCSALRPHTLESALTSLKASEFWRAGSSLSLSLYWSFCCRRPTII